VPGAVAAPGPANVTVRVEGLGSTLVPLTPVTTTATPASGDGGATHCPSGYNAANALSLATTWSGGYSSTYSDYFISTIDGETWPASSGPNAAYTGFYWSFWLNHTAASTGVCGATLGTGDQVLFFPDCSTYGTSTCPPGWVSPNVLGLAVPSVAQRGQPIQATVTSYANSNGAPSPASGATVSSPAGNVTADANGNASLTFNTTGSFTVQATAPNSVRSETRTVCVHNGNDGNCGFAVPNPTPGGPTSSITVPNPALALSGMITGIGEQQHFKKGPRTLTGTITADSAGLQAVQLRLERRSGRACTGFDGTMERFHRIRCGIANAPWFRVTNGPTFSYLLPYQLRPGRYVVELQAIDGAGHADRIDLGRNEIIFYVG
jgi:hypothetical protein